MTIGSINAFSQNTVNFKRKNQNIHQQSPKQPTTKKVVKTAIGLVAIATAIAAGIYFVKSGKVDLTKAKDTFKKFIPKQKPFVSQGPVKGNFKSPADLANEIVKEFNTMKNRVRANNIFQHKYIVMDWTQAITKRSSL